MRRCCLAILIASFAMISSAMAEPHRTAIGVGRLFTNDYIGDGKDRWRTGSYVISVVRGPNWQGQLPARAGSLIEYRLRTEIIAPDKLNRMVPDDRRYAGAASIGAHTHFRYAQTEISVGADAVFLGPQTGLGDFHQAVHEWVGASDVAILDNQLGNTVHLTGLVELGKPLSLGPQTTLRPFLEGQAGVETFMRIGADLHWGRVGGTDLWLRDVSTGHRYRATIDPDITGVSFGIGADYAYLADSAFLPNNGDIDLVRNRWRVRAGVTAQGQRSGVFYGLTYLSEEFDEQEEGQLVGSLRLSIRF